MNNVRIFRTINLWLGCLFFRMEKVMNKDWKLIYIKDII